MQRIFLDSFRESSGSFLFWTWEIHTMSGAQWFWLAGTRFERALYPGPWSPLWLIFYAQQGRRK